jgi:hypothetical protein
MSPGKISEKVVTDRLSWIEEMLDGIRALPLTDLNAVVCYLYATDRGREPIGLLLARLGCQPS